MGQRKRAPSHLNTLTYGPAHDAAVKEAFERDMLGNDYSGWLYNSTENPFGTRDPGYYVGYAICARYFAKASSEQAAIKAMLELDYANQAAVQAFVDASGYFGPQPMAERAVGATSPR